MSFVAFACEFFKSPHHPPHLNQKVRNKIKRNKTHYSQLNKRCCICDKLKKFS